MKRFFVVLILIFLVPLTCFGEGSDVESIVNGTDFSEIERFLEENNTDIDFRELLTSVLRGEQGIDAGTIFEYIKESFVSESKTAIDLMIRITAMALLLSFLKELKPDSLAKSVNNAAFFVCYMIIAFFLAEIFVQAIEAAKGIIYSINSLISMSMPLLMTFMAGSGAAKTAACINPVILIGIEVISVLTSSFFIPLIFALGVLAIFSPIASNIDIASFSRAIKAVLKWSMGLVFSLFAGLITIYAGFGSSSDALAFRAAKYVVGSAVPVVGTLLSDTMGAFTYSCAVVKNAFGTVVIFIIVLIMAVPAIKLFSMMIILNISSVFITSFSDKKISEAVSEIGGVISYILGLVCLTAVLFIICIAVIIHTASNVAV